MTKEDTLEAVKRLEIAVGYACNVANLLPVNPMEMCGRFRIANAWLLINMTYPGLEQAMKVAQDGAGMEPPKTHSLSELWKGVPDGGQARCEDYYRDWTTAMTAGEESLLPDTAKEFIEQISNGYANWRYILREHQKQVVQIHDMPMLQIWLALTDWLDERCQPRGERLRKPPLREAIREFIGESWCDTTNDMLADGLTPDLASRCPTAGEGSTILWSVARRQPLPRRMKEEFQGVGDRWAMEVWQRSRELIPRKPHPFDTPHGQSIQAWLKRAKETNLQWNDSAGRWVIPRNEAEAERLRTPT